MLICALSRCRQGAKDAREREKETEMGGLGQHFLPKGLNSVIAFIVVVAPAAAAARLESQEHNYRLRFQHGSPHRAAVPSPMLPFRMGF